jgi:F-type H+-transporting ATPase subunit a
MTLIEVKLYAPLSGNVVTSLIIVTVLSILAIVIGRKVDKLGPRETPKGFLFAVVLIVDTFNKFIKDNLPGDRFRLFGAYLFTILIYLMVGNTISLLWPQSAPSQFGRRDGSQHHYLHVDQVRRNPLSRGEEETCQFAWTRVADFAVDASNQLNRRILDAAHHVDASVWQLDVRRRHLDHGLYRASLGRRNFAGVVVHAIFDVFFGLIQAFVYFMLSLVTISMASDA